MNIITIDSLYKKFILDFPLWKQEEIIQNFVFKISKFPDLPPLQLKGIGSVWPPPLSHINYQFIKHSYYSPYEEKRRDLLVMKPIFEAARIAKSKNQLSKLCNHF